MFRFLFSFFLTIVAARWIYAEVQMMFPQAVPAIDYALNTVQIPTHDHWDTAALDNLLRQASQSAGSWVPAASATELDYSRSYGRLVPASYSYRGNGCRGGCDTF